MPINASSENVSFCENFQKIIRLDQLEAIGKSCASGRGAPGKLGVGHLLMALVYHFFCGTGTFAAHVLRLTQVKMSDSALSQRRQNLPLEIFKSILKAALRPLCHEQEHPQAFYRGLRLVAMDGTQFSLTNTPQILGSLTKAAARRFKAAFAKIRVCVLVELGAHNPLAASIAEKQESELALCQRLLDGLCPKSLLLADRLFGTGSTVAWVQEACLKAKDSHFLVRVRRNLKSRIKSVEEDGSAIVDIRTSKIASGKAAFIRVREIRGRVHKPGRGWLEVRLWTSLLDAAAYPASELLPLYAKRWEQELYYKQLKLELRSSELLRSHTVETASQEIVALILASAIVARQRVAASAQAEVEPVRISFRKVRDLSDALWVVTAAAEGLLSPDQLRILVERTMKMIASEALLPPRRSRSCPRAVRQPIGSWPRLVETDSAEGALSFEIITARV